uniref:Uncharacterized protein n=1 Tax=Corethron hystrix TaxID=216773 RepID=A0A7S1BQP5_9STRA
MIESELFTASRLLSEFLDDLSEISYGRKNTADEAENKKGDTPLITIFGGGKNDGRSELSKKDDEKPLACWTNSLRNWNDAIMSNNFNTTSPLKFIRSGTKPVLTSEALSSLQHILSLDDDCKQELQTAGLDITEILHQVLFSSCVLIQCTGKPSQSVSVSSATSTGAFPSPSAVSPLSTLPSLVARFNLARFFLPKAVHVTPSLPSGGNCALASLAFHSLLGSLIRANAPEKQDFYSLSDAFDYVNETETSRYASIVSLLCSDEVLLSFDVASTLVKMLHFCVALVKVPTLDYLHSTGDGMGLVQCLVTLLAYLIYSNPVTCNRYQEQKWGELRSGVVVEILRFMYTLNFNHSSELLETSSCNIAGADEETMTHLGVILCEMLQFPNANIYLYEIKLGVVKLLMDLPEGYSFYLLLNGGIDPLVDILTLQLLFNTIEGAPISSEWNHRSGTNGNDASVALLPVLVVLSKLCKANTTICSQVHDRVFPPEEKYEKGGTKEENEKLILEKCPDFSTATFYGTLQDMLIKLMTSTDSNIKRTTSELLWILCNENKDMFVEKTGFGNAIYTLCLKGLISMPKSQ